MNNTNERTTLLLVNIFILSLISTLIWAAIHRGPWIDEIWSLWYSDSNIPFGVAFKNRWLEEPAPALFFATLYGISNIITLDVPTGRLFNIVPMAISGVFFAYLYATDKDKGDRRFLVVFLITIASSYWFIQYFVEFRSYFSGLCAFSVLLVTIRDLCINYDIGKQVNRRIIWVAFSVSLFICLNIHYITSLISAITVATFGVCFLVNGRSIYFIRFALLGILMSIPLILFAFLQSSFLHELSSSFWIKTTPVQGAIMIFLVMISVIAPQVVFCLLVARLILRDTIKIHIFSQEDIVGLNFKYILAIAIFISSTVLLIIDIKTPIIVSRYLIPLAVASIAILADITKDEIFSNQLFLNAFLINSIFIAVLFGLHFGNQQQWYASASAVKNHLGGCQTSKVIAEDFGRPTDSGTPTIEKNGKDVLRFGYEYTAKKLGIPTNDLNLKNDNHELRECPDVIWVEAGPDIIWMEQPTVPSLHEQLTISQERERDIRYFLSRNPQYINHNISLEIFNEGRAWRGFVFLVEK